MMVTIFLYFMDLYVCVRVHHCCAYIVQLNGICAEDITIIDSCIAIASLIIMTRKVLGENHHWH